MDVEAWLQGLGLERYARAFRDNEIDWEVLPKLTSEDLREIGVAAIGHRRKLLDAIAALGASASTTAATAAVSDASASPDAERRQLTVMFRSTGSAAASFRSLRPISTTKPRASRRSTTDRRTLRCVDGQPAHDRPAAIEDDEVERKARELGRSRVGDHEIGAAIAALIFETIELDPNRRRRFGAGRCRPTKQRAPSKTSVCRRSPPSSRCMSRRGSRRRHASSPHPASSNGLPRSVTCSTGW